MGASRVPPESCTKLRPVMPCSCSWATVSVLTGVPARIATVTWMSSTLSASMAISVTVPTGTPRYWTGAPFCRPVTEPRT
jgi:hypothetical protein